MADIEMLELPDSDTTCSICYAEFLEPEDLSIHIYQVHSNEIRASLYHCHFCPRTLSDLEAYSIHIRDIHLCDLKSCKYCNRVFTDFSALKKHEQSHQKHWSRSKYYCSNCTMVFTTLVELEIHEVKMHKDSKNGIILHDIFPILSSLLNVKVTRFLQCLGEEDVLYYCVNCEYSTPTVTDYIQHLTEKDCRSLACHGCLSVYKHKKGLRRHFAAHPECHQGVDNVKECPECCKKYDIKVLREHIKVCQAIKCKKCNIVFASMNELTKHQMDYHPATVHLQVCKYCKKDFASNLALTKHIMRSHKSQFHLYKYKCIYCDIIFKHPKKLFGHFFSTHKDLEPYNCKICDKKFKIRKSFTLHIKLDHKSIGFVEFDERYHVFFSAQKSEKPFNPTSFYTNEYELDDENNLLIEKVTKPTNKVRFDVEEKEDDTDINLVNFNSDFMSATETEGNQTENEIGKTPTLKRKLTTKSNRRKKQKIETIDEIVLSNSSDEDEPLLQVKKRVSKMHKIKLQAAYRMRNLDRFKNSKKKGSYKNRFVCNICNKQCYTYQNYNNHIAQHKKNALAKCVKCSKVCKSKTALTEHYVKEHSSSQLTETLKNLLAKRKNLSKSKDKREMTSNEKFKLTIKKVSIPTTSDMAVVRPVGDKPLSVQKFIESFMPEAEGPKKEINIEKNIIIKHVSGINRKNTIKMTKCNLDNPQTFYSRKLALPVPFKPTNEQHKVTVKIVTPVTKMSDNEDNGYNYESFDQGNYYPEDYTGQDNEQIPEVAQEVMLEGTDEPTPKTTIYIPHKVVIPELPTQCKKIHIGHLQPQAPYYKIVKVEEALNPKKVYEEKKPKRDIKLPDGTTLVSVNPLAHLLGDKPVEQILEGTKNKHYQPKPKDFESAVAKAMLKLKATGDEPPRKRRRKNEDQKH